jgi:hypothetical protein
MEQVYDPLDEDVKVLFGKGEWALGVLSNRVIKSFKIVFVLMALLVLKMD